MSTTRRSFLKAAAVTPMIIPAGLWAAETSPNGRITVGFIGMGKQSRGLLDLFMSRSQVLAVCDVDTTRRENAKKRVDDYYTRYPNQGKAGCTAYVDFEELLARKDIDAVCIATPDHWHALITLAALRAGKDVYCEKPLTHNISEAIEVDKEVDLQGRVMQTGSMQRSSREFRVACELATKWGNRQNSAYRVQFRRPRKTLRSARRADGTGTGLEFLAGPCGDAAL